MESKSAARYAKSLLDLAEELKVEDAVYEDFTQLKSIIKKNKELAAVLNSPIISGFKKGVILNKIFAGKVHRLTTAFFELINKKNREGQLADIVEKFIELYNLRRGFSQATVTSAHPLTPQALEKIRAFVEKKSTNKIQINERVDPALIGGFKIQIGDLLLDTSVATQLKAIHEKLINKSYVKKI